MLATGRGGGGHSRGSLAGLLLFDARFTFAHEAARGHVALLCTARPGLDWRDRDDRELYLVARVVGHDKGLLQDDVEALCKGIDNVLHFNVVGLHGKGEGRDTAVARDVGIGALLHDQHHELLIVHDCGPVQCGVALDISQVEV